MFVLFYTKVTIMNKKGEKVVFYVSLVVSELTSDLLHKETRIWRTPKGATRPQ